MDPGYNDINLQTIKNNLKLLGIPAEIHNTDIFEIANSQTKSPCFLCAKMRRGALYNIAKSMGCNKIALGHHYDDVIETTLMNLLSSGSFQTMLPKLHSTNYEGMEVIRPMYYIREKDIIKFKKDNNLNFIQCACRFTENCAICDNGGGGSRRAYIKDLIKKLRKDIPQVEENLFMAPNNVTLDMILGYKKDGKYYSYLDEYDEKAIHVLNLRPEPFALIKNNQKHIEMRLNDEKRSLIKVGDPIKFIETETKEELICDVLALYPFKDFKELYSYFDKKELGYKEDEIADPRDMNIYYSDEKIEKYGVLGIRIKVHSSAL